MRAIRLDHFGGLDRLLIKEIPEPEPAPVKVVIRIKAFAINHAEMRMRRGEWAEAAAVSGIEYVGIVKSCPSGEFAVGGKVAALICGLGRTINGSYAEYTRANNNGILQLYSNLPWEDSGGASRNGSSRGEWENGCETLNTITRYRGSYVEQDDHT
jgi:NADPH:quinone reductase-like Zn-dependent oxidoreductase